MSGLNDSRRSAFSVTGTVAHGIGKNGKPEAGHAQNSGDHKHRLLPQGDGHILADVGRGGAREADHALARPSPGRALAIPRAHIGGELG